MSITADPLFVAAEVAYRRETMTAGQSTVGRARRHHAVVQGVLAFRPRLHHRHGLARHA